MPEIRLARIDEDLSDIRELFWEYLQWVNARFNDEFGVSYDIATKLEDDMKGLDTYVPPDGRLILAYARDKSAGLGCLKKLQNSVGEIKRVYVRPEFRGRGLGRRIVATLLSEARDIGYAKVRLDTAGFMAAAQSLYRSCGFQDIEPYVESESPPELREHWVFMEKTLVD